MNIYRMLVAGALALLPSCLTYATTVYSDSTSFLNQVEPGYYLETFDNDAFGNEGNALSFSGNGFSYQGLAYGGYSYGNGQFYGAYYGGNLILAVTQQGTDFTLTFSPNITAVGGTFFMIDSNLNVTDGVMTITLLDGTQVTINDGTPFTGFTSPTPIGSLTVDSNRLSALDNLYVGAFTGALSGVPEPRTLGLLAGGLGFMLARRRLRRYLDR